MTLTDTGPLVAIIDRGDPSHARCVQVLPSLSKPLITALPSLTEAMYFLGKRFGWSGQEALWRLARNRTLEVAPIDEATLDRLHELMEQYRDTPMDLADASLVALAETRGLQRIFTLDSHFYAFRLRNRRPLEVIPGPGP